MPGLEVFVRGGTVEFNVCSLNLNAKKEKLKTIKQYKKTQQRSFCIHSTLFDDKKNASIHKTCF